MTSSRRRARGLGAAALTAAVATATLAAPALAAPSGNTTIALKGPAARALRSQQVAISAKKPARAGAKRIVLPVHGATVNKNAARLTHRGAVTLRAKHGKRTRTVTLTAWRTQVGKKRSTISAKVGAKRVTLFTVAAPQRRVTLNATAGTARVTGATARLTPAGAKALRARLALRTLPAAQLGGAKVTAKTGKTSGRSNTPGTGGGTPNPGTGGGTGNPGTGGGGTPPPVGQCQGFDTSDEVPVAADPPVKAAGASDVAAVNFVWTPLLTWTQYISTGEGITYADGAHSTPERLSGSSATLPYRFTFTLDAARSWYDAGENRGVLYHRGTIRYRYSERFIDITFRDPVIVIDGARSRLILTASGSECARLVARPADIVTFAAAPTATAPTYDFGQFAPILTEGGSNTMGGVYFPGDPRGWGTITLSLTTG